MRSAVYQATCSPFRNPLDSHERAAVVLTMGGKAASFARALARSAGAADPRIRWRVCEGPYFDNQVGSLKIEGRRATARLDKTVPGEHHERELTRTFERRLA
jgi:hypothetical protein